MYKLLVTGSRNQVSGLLADRIRYGLGTVAYRLCPEGGLLVHGGASGVDEFSAEYWESLGPEYDTKAFPYPSELGRSGGPIRNQQMVDFGADLCLGFPIEGSRGTFDCMRKAKSAHIPTFSLSGFNDLQLFERFVVAHKRMVW